MTTTLTPNGNQLNIEISDPNKVDTSSSKGSEEGGSVARDSKAAECKEANASSLTACQVSEHSGEEAGCTSGADIGVSPPISSEDTTTNQDQEKANTISGTMTGTTSLEPISAEAKSFSSSEATGEALHDAERESLLTGPAVRVEEDGSVFIRGDSGYMRERDTITAALGGGQQQPATTDHTPSSRVKLSNKLLYSLD